MTAKVMLSDAHSLENRISAMELELKCQKEKVDAAEDMRKMFLDLLAMCEEFESRVTLLEKKANDCQYNMKTINNLESSMKKNMDSGTKLAADTKRLMEAAHLRTTKLETCCEKLEKQIKTIESDVQNVNGKHTHEYIKAQDSILEAMEAVKINMVSNTPTANKESDNADKASSNIASTAIPAKYNVGLASAKPKVSASASQSPATSAPVSGAGLNVTVTHHPRPAPQPMFLGAPLHHAAPQLAPYMLPPLPFPPMGAQEPPILVTASEVIQATEYMAVVGREGRVINWVRACSGASVVIRERKREEGCVNVRDYLITYCGTQDQLTVAKQMVTQIRKNEINPGFLASLGS